MIARWSFAAALVMVMVSGTANTANAAEEPDNVAADAQYAAQQCRAIGGSPNTDGMLRAFDFSGKGFPDWIVDFAKLRCEGKANPFCGNGGCALHLYVGSAGPQWTRIFKENVRSYKVTTFGGRTALQVATQGAICREHQSRTCVLVFDHGALKRVP